MASSTEFETKKVTFSDVVNTGPFTEGSSEQHELYESSSDESFAEIITSEEEVQFSSSDEEDEARVLTMLEGVYCCNPALFSSDYADPVERHSLLLLDKDAMKVQVSHSCEIIRVENSI